MSRFIFLLVLVSSFAVVCGCTVSGEEEDAGEVTLGLQEAPAAVQQAIRDAAGSGQIREIERETRDGKTVYEAEIVINGQVQEITLAEDGTRLPNDDDEGDDDDDDDDEEDDD